MTLTYRARKAQPTQPRHDRRMALGGHLLEDIGDGTEEPITHAGFIPLDELGPGGPHDAIEDAIIDLIDDGRRV